MERTIVVEGMRCEQTVEAALRGVDGVTSAADWEAERATVGGRADVEALVAAVEEAGYTARA